ncbi:MAG: hypothetical protein H7837_09370 [Magnetococcus sp. MYC-9]
MTSGPHRELSLLMFQILGTRLGIETGQIACARPLQAPPEVGDGLCYFHERVAFHGVVPDYRSPVILHPAAHLERRGGLIVDQLETIRSVERRAIFRLPRRLAFDGINPYWGVARLEEGLLLLVDLARLLHARA